MTPAGYPPAHHILGDLAIEVECLSASRADARLPVTSHLLGADGGVSAGVLAILCDVLGGAVAVRAVPEGRVATADLSLQVGRPLVGPVVEAQGTVLRTGRTTLVIEVGLHDTDPGTSAGRVDPATDAAGSDRAGEGHGPAASATLTFAVLPTATATDPTAADTTGAAWTDPATGAGRRAGGDGPEAEARFELPMRWAFAGRGLDRPIADALSLEVTDATTGAVSLARDDYLANSFGAVQGGVIGLVADVAATTALERVGPPGGGEAGAVVVDGMQIAYLAQGRVGPITSTVHVLAPVGLEGPGGAVVTLTDAGADGRVTTVVNVSAHSEAVAGGVGPIPVPNGRSGD